MIMKPMEILLISLLLLLIISINIIIITTFGCPWIFFCVLIVMCFYLL